MKIKIKKKDVDKIGKGKLYELFFNNLKQYECFELKIKKKKFIVSRIK